MVEDFCFFLLSSNISTKEKNFYLPIPFYLHFISISFYTKLGPTTRFFVQEDSSWVLVVVSVWIDKKVSKFFESFKGNIS